MFLRAVVILVAVAAVSVGLTLYFGETVLVALGLILTQLKFVAKKLSAVQWPSVLIWLKSETQSFFQIELLKKWMMTSLMPLLIGSAVLRRIDRFIAGYTELVRRQYVALFDWYTGLQWYEKTVAALILLFTLLGLTVSSLGLWLILFSVKLPLWILAALASAWQITWASIRKMAFRTVAFLQLSWLWRELRRMLPQSYLDRKRRLDFRMARMVVKKRRMTLRQLASQKDSWRLKWAIWTARFRRLDR
ncbi:MAG: hypothetical protein AAGK37_01220 [Pseudomonadota bacterium]